MADGEDVTALGKTPIEELAVEAVDWRYRGEHIRTRSQRKGPNEFDVEPEWATEAALDPHRIVWRASEASIGVLGLSASAEPLEPGDPGRVLKVWLVPKSLARGEWWGASACDANDRDLKDYWNERGGG